MKAFTTIRRGILASGLAFGSWTNGNAMSCPTNMDPALCEKLQPLNDTDWITCRIDLVVAFSWHDNGCARGDTACVNHQDTSWLQPYRDSILTESRLLFEGFDLRWPDAPLTRASMPTGDGPQDTVTGQDHRPSVAYIVSVTKSSILSIVGEPYIGAADNWTKPDWTSIRHPKTLAPAASHSPLYNLNGQMIHPEKAPGINVLWVPRGH
jgi:hypothetical protein